MEGWRDGGREGRAERYEGWRERLRERRGRTIKSNKGEIDAVSLSQQCSIQSSVSSYKHIFRLVSIKHTCAQLPSA